MKFPKLEDLATNTEYNNILIIVNRLIKYTYLISYIEKFTANRLLRLFWTELFNITEY